MIRNIIVSILLTVLFVGCDDFLDYNEVTFYEDREDIFGNFNRTRQFLANIYSRLPDDFNTMGGAMRSAASDEAEFVKQSAAIQNFTNGQWNPSNALDNNWANYYNGIRSANLFLEEIAGRTFEDYKYNEDYQNQMIRFERYPYEARFLRAFFYFELAKRYGDVPMPEGVVNDVKEINSIERTDFKDVIAFIVEECDAIKDRLPVTWKDQVFVETGRVTRGAVQALKVRALLYAASPLHNPEKDVAKWEAAANAANEFLTDSRLIYSFDNQYYNSNNMARGVFNNRASAELIFERRQANSNDFEKNNFPMGFEGASGNATCPSQNLIDAYQTTDGYDVVLENGVWSAPGSFVFDPEKPYDNRDPRLLRSVIVNGKKWKDITVETFRGGANGLPMADATTTGYYLKKYVREDIVIAGPNAAPKEHVWVIFRLAEIYLSLAEAMNEAYGPTAMPAGYIFNAVSALNQVRTRTAVGMSSVFGVSKDELRSTIIRERQVELAFEDHRFWDVRRWRLHDINNPNYVSPHNIYGVEIIKNNGVLSYSKKLVKSRVWDDKMYLYPIPHNERLINPNLGQNPGW